MKITSTTISLTVEDPSASAVFLREHLGFTQDMAADGFAALSRKDVGVQVVYLRAGLETLPADQRDKRAAGLILALTVEDLEAELARLQGEGVAITMPLTVDDWGERAFQVRDPNGVIVQLLDWGGPGAPAGP